MSVDKNTQGNIRFDPKVIEAMRVIIIHAKELLSSARAVLSIGHFNIAYHLAVLALEEVGRRQLLGMKAIGVLYEQDAQIPHGKMDNHEHKLFWAFLGPQLMSQKIGREAIETMQELARSIHANRLSGLYVDIGDAVSVPSKAVSQAQAENIIALAEARISMEEQREFREELPAEESEIQRWFMKVTQVPEKLKMIMSKHSLEKLAELGEAKGWMTWLRDEFNKADTESRALLESELQRSRAGDSKGIDKWRLRIRILTQSHSLRPKEFSEWNKTVRWIQLSVVSGKKDQIFVDFILGDMVPINGLWHFGWGLSRQFVVALNIGTMGFWWWRMPLQISRYYENIKDLENGSEVIVERNPMLKVDWGENRVLRESDLSLVSQCFAVLTALRQRDEQIPYDFYVAGITFMSLNDIHWQCERQAFGNFFHSLREMMRQEGEWNGKNELIPCLMKFLSDLFPSFDETDRYLEIFSGYHENAVDNLNITLKEASFMKLFCDAYFINRVRPRVLANIDREIRDVKDK